MLTLDIRMKILKKYIDMAKSKTLQLIKPQNATPSTRRKKNEIGKS